MWELIAANRRKSALLFFMMGIVLLILGYFVGAAYFYPDGGYYGLAIAGAIWILLSGPTRILLTVFLIFPLFAKSMAIGFMWPVWY